MKKTDTEVADDAAKMIAQLIGYFKEVVIVTGNEPHLHEYFSVSTARAGDRLYIHACGEFNEKEE